MKTSVHAAASLILAAVLYPLFKWKVLLILVGGVLIDVDHYLWYIHRYKKFNIINSYNFFLKNIERNDFTNVYGILLIFHTVEFLLVMAVLSFYSEFALIFTIGLLFHYLLDVIFMYSVSKRLIMSPSIVQYLIKFKKFK